MDALTQTFYEVLAAVNGDLDLLYQYLVDLYGTAFTEGVITEDVIID